MRASLQLGERVRDTVVRGLFAERGVRGVSLKVQAGLRQPGESVQTVKQTLGQFGPELNLETARARAQGLLSTIKSRVDPRAPAPEPGKLTVRRMLEVYSDDLRTRGGPSVRYRSIPTCSTSTCQPSPTGPWRVSKRASSEPSTHGSLWSTAPRSRTRRCEPSVRRSTLRSSTRTIPRRSAATLSEFVTFHPERRKGAVFLPGDLADWYGRLQKIPNPLRCIMHELGLFSGLRPGVLVALEKAWVQLEDSAIVIPQERMKSRRDFALPLSAHMIGLIRRALVLSNEVASSSQWLFPSRTADGSEVIATQVVRERSMPSETGHILRHTHATLAKAAGVDDMLASLLSDHKVAGIRGVYVHERALFEQLLGAQEKVTAHIVSLLS